MFGADPSRIFGLPPGVDFASELARGVLHRLQGQPPEALGRVRILTNARRAARRIEEVFHAQGPLILPRIDVIPELASDPIGPLPPVKGTSPLSRQLHVMQMVTALLRKEPNLAPLSAAFDLSHSLVELLDEMQGEAASFDDLFDVDLGDLNVHRQITLKFLQIIADVAASDGDQDPSSLGSDAQQRLAVDALAAAWAIAPPRDPVIVAGSTGSRGATRRLMEAVANLPNGALVLPGFDFDLDDRAWEALDEGIARHDHPQHGFRLLSQELGFGRGDVSRWTPTDPPSTARNRLVSLSLRAAPVTDEWFRSGPALVPELAGATAAITWMEPPTPRHEAAAIAIAIKRGLRDGQSVALITPDGTLSRRVAAHLSRWSITPDESGGVPLTLTPPAVFLSLVMAGMDPKLHVADFLALMKHPLAASGGDRGAHMRWLRAFEKRHLRSGAPYVDWDVVAAWGQKTKCEGWVAWMREAFAARGDAAGGLDAFVAAHRRVASVLAAGPESTDATELWDVGAGPQCAAIMDRMADESDTAGQLHLSDYRTILSRLLASEQTRLEGFRPDPRVAIWGLLEARVQTADLVILGGLNEGVWPSQPSPDPWLNRQMRARIGLPAPDRQIGLSAHDFQQAIGQGNVIISRSLRDGSAPTVASRWLTRLENLMGGLGAEGETALEAMRQRGAELVDLADRIDRPLATIPAEPRACPAPPLDARPDGFSATAIERLTRDPYAIYARQILRLTPMDPPTRDPNAMDRGIALHEVMEAFVKETQSGLPPDPVAAFLDVADRVLSEHVSWTAARRIWIARLSRIAEDIVADEVERREAFTPLKLEVTGRIAMPGLIKPMRLNATADRIDRNAHGQLAIFDYKSSLPSEKQEKIFSKQLPIEALIAERGGFDGIGKSPVIRMELIGLSKTFGTRELQFSAEEMADIWAKLCDLLALYLQPSTGYPARLFPFKTEDAGEYDHLARRGEWADGADYVVEPIA